MTFFNQN